MKRIEKKEQVNQEEVRGLVNSLSSALTPISPSIDMMQRLKERIGDFKPNRIAKRLSNWELSIITVGSVMSAAMVILTIARAFFYFFGRHRRRIA